MHNQSSFKIAIKGNSINLLNKEKLIKGKLGVSKNKITFGDFDFCRTSSFVEIKYLLTWKLKTIVAGSPFNQAFALDNISQHSHFKEQTNHPFV